MNDPSTKNAVPSSRGMSTQSGSSTSSAVAAPLDLRSFATIIFGSGDNEIKFLIFHFRIEAAATIYQRFHLCTHRIEIDGRCHDYDIGGNHFFDHFGGLVFLRTRLAVHATYTATCAVVYVFVF